MSYFAHSYCSNSDLSQLARDLSAADAVEYKDAYRMGTLVHAMVLEPEKVDHYKLTCGEYSYTAAEFQLRAAWHVLSTLIR
jgi:hypothetical protein